MRPKQLENYLILTSALLLFETGYSQTQLSPPVEPRQKTESTSGSLSWEIAFGGNFLTNTDLSRNLPLSSVNSISKSYHVYLDVAIGRKRSENTIRGFSLRPGFGASIQNFGLNRIIETSNGRSEFRPFPLDKKYHYSTMQLVFIDVPVNLVYSTAPNRHNVAYECMVAPIAGVLIEKEKRTSEGSAGEYNTSKSNQIRNLNTLQYGVSGKINSRTYRPGKKVGFQTSLGFSYYFNDLFQSRNNTPTKSYSILFGVGLFIH